MTDHIRDCIRRAYRHCNRMMHRDIVSLSSAKPGGNRLLLSYLTHPFRTGPDDPVFFSHTNTWECRQIAETWLQHGYDVDVIDWDNTWFLPKKEYSVFIDIHSNMERIAPLLKSGCRKILHITGAHWRFQNEAEMKRLAGLERRRGIRLAPRRQVAPSRGIEFADCATILGNVFTKGTFAFSNKPLCPLPLPTAVTFPFIEKDFSAVRKNFLWLGGMGMVHKGLDLVLDAFRELPDCTLTICGPVDREPDFERAYREELYGTDTIRTLGFVDIRGDRFREIIRNTGALIYPSCSEGQAGSVVTCMHAGLIPVISYESGVDAGDFGIILKECSVDEIRKTVTRVARTPAQDLHRMSEKAWRYARAHHIREKFAERYDGFVNEILVREE